MNCEEHYDNLSFFENGVGFKCDACDRSYGAGISCAECKFSIHWDCTFVFDINDHPSHVGHCLKLLTTGAPDHTNPKCHLCGKNTKRLLYHCSDCKLNLDLDCIVDALCARANLNMPWHHHPLLMFNFQVNMYCQVCLKICTRGYLCPCCKLVIHEGCVSVFDSPEITHPSHVRHPLKLITNGAPDYTDRKCHLTGDYVGNLLYHCDNCKFNKCSKSDDCSFILHKTCADLLKKKRHFLSPKPLNLYLRDIGYCKACRQVCCRGFMYSSIYETYDLLCSSITVPFIHGSHDHHLLYLKPESNVAKTCQSCGMDETGVVIGPNNTSSRPLCNNCHSRCPGPFVVNEVLSIFSFCSYYCFVSACIDCWYNHLY